MAGITARSKARGIGFLACMLFLLGIFTLYLDSFEKIKKTITVESIEKSKEEDTLIGGKLDITGYEDGNPVIGTTVEIEEQVKINQGLRGWSTHIFIILAVGANCVAADRLKRTGRYGGETRTSEGYLASAFAFFFVLIWMKILSFFGFALTYVSTFIIMCYGILAYLGSIINILEDLHSERGASSSHLFFQSNDEKTTMMMMICFVPLVMYSIWTKPYLQHISLIQSNATGINDAKDESMFSFMFSFMEFSFADINRECIVALAIGCNLLTAKLNKNQSRELKQFLEHWEVGKFEFFFQCFVICTLIITII